MNKKMHCFTTGLAIFAMFFGAGNIIFPLALGQMALHKTAWGLCGFLFTAVAMPAAGLLAMFRYKGQITLFFSHFGKIPGLIMASLIIALLGPFGAAPRCLTLAHSTLALSFPQIPLVLLSALACIIIFFFVYRENRLLPLLGNFLSPIKIALLILILVKGFTSISLGNEMLSSLSNSTHFLQGLKQGYNTMDLLAAFFFAPIIIFSLTKVGEERMGFVYKATAIGAGLLGLIYIGFGYLAYFYAPYLEGVAPDRLLGTIAITILGPYAGLIVGLTVTMACLTTAIALIAAFASFVHKELCNGKGSYSFILLCSLGMTFMISSLEFQGIAQFLTPILTLCYPILILLTLYNLFMPMRKTKKV